MLPSISLKKPGRCITTPLPRTRDKGDKRDFNYPSQLELDPASTRPPPPALPRPAMLLPMMLWHDLWQMPL